MSTRAEQRKLRQLEIENEQRLEDVEALKMTEEQRDILLRTFQSVKFEFHDLDGLSWSDPIRQQLKQPEPVSRAVSPCQDQQPRQQPTFVVLTKAELAAFSPDDTIRISAAHQPSSPPHEAEPCWYTDDFETPVLRRGKRDGIRSRSPIKGLFSTLSDTSADPALGKADDQATIRPRELPRAVAEAAAASLDHLTQDSWPDSSAPPTPWTSSSYVSFPSLASPISSKSPHLQPPPPATSSTPTKNVAGAGIITSIFRSPVFTVPKGKMSQVQCSVVSSPKSSPSLSSICRFSSP